MKTLTSTSTTAPINKWFALALLCAAQFLVIMDTSIIGVALPAIQESLNYTSSNLQWIFNAYVIAFGGFLLLGGKLSDVYGSKKVFMSGFLILTLSSLFTGLAWNETSMNIGRAIQGFGSALIAPSALTLLMTIFTDQKDLAKAFGFWGAAAAAGGSAGVFLGGVLTEYLSWRWTLFINIPIGLFVIIAGINSLPKGSQIKSKIDYWGALLITGAISLLVYTLVTVEQHGWVSATTITLFAVAVILFLLLRALQKKISQPLIPPAIFKAPNLIKGNVVMALLAGAWIPLWFFLNLYLQQVLELNAFYSGLALLPMTIAIMIFMIAVTGKVIQKAGPKNTLNLGLLALAVALIWFILLPENGTYMVHVLWPSLLGAIGMSLAYIPATIISVSGAKQEEQGLASGIVNVGYQVGSAIGLAVAVALSGDKLKEVATAVNQKAALTDSYQIAFICAFVIILMALIAGLSIKLKNNNTNN